MKVVGRGVAAAKLGETAEIVGMVTTTTAAVADAMVGTGEACRVLVVGQDAAEGETRAEPTWSPQLWGRHWRAVEQRTRSFSVGRLVHLLPLVFGLEHGQRRGGRGFGKKQVTLSLMDIVFSAERLSKLTVSGDHTKPISLDLARARTAEIATAVATAEATLDDSVRRAYVKLSYKDVSSISVLPFPAFLNKSDGTQQLTRSVRSAMSDMPMRCDDRCTEGVRAPAWVTGWTHPLKLAFNRSITPDKPTTARMTTLTDDFFGQVSRAIHTGASGSEAFTLLLRLLVTHFDRVDTGEGYTRLHTFGGCNGTPFSDFSWEVRVLVSAVTGSERVLFPGTDAVLEVVLMAVNEQFPTLMPTSYPGSKVTDPRPFASLDAMWRAFCDLAHNKTPVVNREKHVALPVSSTGARSSAPSGPRPADHGRGQGRVPS